MGLADLHIHSSYSGDGTASVRAILKFAAHHTDLDVIAITDHDEIDGALEAIQLAPEYAIEVIPGTEVTCAEGHVLGLFVTKKVPAGLSFLETIARIGELGGLAIAAHPFAKATSAVSRESILKALNHRDLSKILVGLECYNAGLFVERDSNREVTAFAENLPVARLGNSDAHTAWGIGSGRTSFPGKTASELRQALLERQTRAIIQKDLPGPVLIADWLAAYSLRLAGYVFDNQAPETGFHIARSKQPLPDLTTFFFGSYKTA